MCYCLRRCVCGACPAHSRGHGTRARECRTKYEGMRIHSQYTVYVLHYPFDIICGAPFNLSRARRVTPVSRSTRNRLKLR